MLKLAWEHFQTARGSSLRPEFERFVANEANWLEDYALFMALKDTHEGRSWQEWPEPAKLRQADFIKKSKNELAKKVGLHQFRQFVFFRQWQRLKNYAGSGPA